MASSSLSRACALAVPRSVRDGVVTAILAVLLSTFCVVGYQSSVLQAFWSVPHTLVFVLLFALVWFVALELVWRLLDRTAAWQASRGPRPFSRRQMYIAAGVVALGWLPYFLGGFPGYFNYDAGAEWLMQWGQIESGVLNAHHPVIHTLFLKYTIELGEALFGSFNGGIALSVVIQAVIVWAVFLGLFRWMRMTGFGRVALWVSAAYLALNPIVALFAISTTKDTFFSSAMLAFGLSAYTLFARADADRKVSPGTYLVLTVSGLFICLLRSNGLAAMAIIVPVLFIAIRRCQKLQFLACSAVFLALAWLWLGPISTAMNVQESPIGTWNSLCIVEQQLARAYTDPDVSLEDKQMMGSVIGQPAYRASLSDISRSAFMTADPSMKDLLKLWVKIGLKYPSVYFEALVYQTEMAWSPFSVIRVYGTEEDSRSVFSARWFEPASSDSKLPAVKDFVSWLSYKAGPEKIPGLNLLISNWFYLYVLLVVLARALIVWDRPFLGLLVAPLVLTLTGLLAPAMLIRYFLYNVFLLPAFVGLTSRSGAPALVEASETKRPAHAGGRAECPATRRRATPRHAKTVAQEG